MATGIGIRRTMMIITSMGVLAASACAGSPQTEPIGAATGGTGAIESPGPDGTGTADTGGGAYNNEGGANDGGGGAANNGGGGDANNGGGGGGGSNGGGGSSGATPSAYPSATASTPSSAPTSAASRDCLYGKWKQQAGSWTLPGSSWGLSGMVTVKYASPTTGTTDNVILFEWKADVSRNVYTEDLLANYMQGYGNPQPSLTLTGRDYGDFSVSGNTVNFTNGSTIQMVYRMDTTPVSTKNVKRLVTSAQFTCDSTTLTLTDSAFTGTYKRLY